MRHFQSSKLMTFGGIAALAILAQSVFSEVKPLLNKITLESPKIKQGETIPKDYTADGRNVSPPLAWKGTPAKTTELALICDDPDAPMKEPFVHWVIYNIPATATGFPEGLSSDETLKEPKELAGTIQGVTGMGKAGYRGPSPPKGKVHHYHFKLYALDAKLNLKPGLNKTKLLDAMKGHVIGEGELVGTYER